METPDAIEIPFLLQNKTIKKITIDINGVLIEKARSFDLPVFIPAEKIGALRYGVNWIKGYRFIVGRHYFIEIKDIEDKIFKIKLKSYYGLKREAYFELWNEIMNRLWQNYFLGMLNSYIALYEAKQPFELTGVRFLFEGISWDKNKVILWKDIGLSNYATYFMIHHKENPKEHTSRDFAKDWNALVLQRLLKEIVKSQSDETFC